MAVVERFGILFREHVLPGGLFVQLGALVVVVDRDFDGAGVHAFLGSSH